MFSFCIQMFEAPTPPLWLSPSKTRCVVHLLIPRRLITWLIVSQLMKYSNLSEPRVHHQHFLFISFPEFILSPHFSLFLGYPVELVFKDVQAERLHCCLPIGEKQVRVNKTRPSTTAVSNSKYTGQTFWKGYMGSSRSMNLGYCKWSDFKAADFIPFFFFKQCDGLRPSMTPHTLNMRQL